MHLAIHTHFPCVALLREASYQVKYQTGHLFDDNRTFAPHRSWLQRAFRWMAERTIPPLLFVVVRRPEWRPSRRRQATGVLAAGRAVGRLQPGQTLLVPETERCRRSGAHAHGRHGRTLLRAQLGLLSFSPPPSLLPAGVNSLTN